MGTKQQYSVAAARAAGERDELGRWVTDFLGSPGSDNAALAEQLSGRYRWWLGPVRLPIDHLHRLAGPPGQPVVVTIEDGEWWRDDVEDMKEQVEGGWEPPPVIVTWKEEEQQLVVEDGNHRIEGLLRAGVQEAWAVVGFERLEDRDRFAA